VYRVLDKYDTLRARERTLRGVYRDALAIPEDPDYGKSLALIKTAVQQDVNRRFSALHFWPPSAGTSLSAGEQWAVTVQGKHGDTMTNVTLMETAERARWFRFREAAETYGLDVSSSQSQIVAVLVGSDDLARISQTIDPPLKKRLAQIAWDSGLCPAGYAKPDNERLVRFMKALWLRVGYGSEVSQVLIDTLADMDYVPDGFSWVERDEDGNLLVKEAAEAIRTQLLRLIPGFGDLERFLGACQRVGQLADPYEGVILVDPLDGEVVRWNEPALEAENEPVSVGDKWVYIRSPKGLRDERGDYPVAAAKLQQRIGPCLVHMADAFWNALVIEGLAERGVESFYAVHDLWAVPDTPEGRKALHDSLAAAGEPWLRGLGPIYERLEHYLSKDPDRRQGEYARQLHQRWENRVARQDWPRFAVDEAQLRAYSGVAGQIPRRM
jgi:hypothetical protein